MTENIEMLLGRFDERFVGISDKLKYIEDRLNENKSTWREIEYRLKELESLNRLQSDLKKTEEDCDALSERISELEEFKHRVKGIYIASIAFLTLIGVAVGYLIKLYTGP